MGAAFAAIVKCVNVGGSCDRSKVPTKGLVVAATRIAICIQRKGRDVLTAEAPASHAVLSLFAPEFFDKSRAGEAACRSMPVKAPTQPLTSTSSSFGLFGTDFVANVVVIVV